jgi:hypothetical protein
MTPTDNKYADLARETWGKTSCDIAYRDRDIGEIARALERVALEAILKDRDEYIPGMRRYTSTTELRARLKELEAKDA